MSLAPRGGQMASRGGKPRLLPFPPAAPQLPLPAPLFLPPAHTTPGCRNGKGIQKALHPTCFLAYNCQNGSPLPPCPVPFPPCQVTSKGCPPLSCMMGGPHLLPQPKVSKPRLQREHELPAGLPEAPDFFRVLPGRLTPQDHTFQLLLQGRRPLAGPQRPSLSSAPSTSTPQLFSRSLRPGSKCS